MARHLRIGPVEFGVVAVGVGDAGPEMVATENFGTPSRSRNRLIEGRSSRAGTRSGTPQ